MTKYYKELHQEPRKWHINQTLMVDVLKLIAFVAAAIVVRMIFLM